MALFAVSLALGATAFVVDAIETRDRSEGMAEASVCQSADMQAGCLRRVPGSAEDTRGTRSTAWDWRFRPAPASSESEVQTVSFAPATDRRVEQLDRVEGLYWRGELVAFYDPSTRTLIKSQEFGARGWTTRGLWAVTLMSGAWLTVLIARRKRALSGGWWARPPDQPLTSLMTTRSAWGSSIIAMASLMGWFALFWGASLTVAFLVGAVSAALPIIGLVRQRGPSATSR